MKSWLEEQNPLVLVVLAIVAGVVGLVALVALTIVLAAVAGTFVLDLGGEAGATAPAAAFTADESNDGLVVSHASGDAVEAGDLQLVYRSGDGETLKLTWAEASDLDPGDEVSPGNTVVLDVDAERGDTLRVVWTGGDRDAVLSSQTV